MDSLGSNKTFFKRRWIDSFVSPFLWNRHTAYRHSFFRGKKRLHFVLAIRLKGFLNIHQRTKFWIIWIFSILTMLKALLYNQSQKRQISLSVSIRNTQRLKRLAFSFTLQSDPYYLCRRIRQQATVGVKITLMKFFPVIPSLFEEHSFGTFGKNLRAI